MSPAEMAKLIRFHLTMQEADRLLDEAVRLVRPDAPAEEFEGVVRGLMIRRGVIRPEHWPVPAMGAR